MLRSIQADARDFVSYKTTCILVIMGVGGLQLYGRCKFSARNNNEIRF